MSMKNWKPDLRKPQQLGVVGLGIRSLFSVFVFWWMAIRLVFFVIFLLPAFLRIGWWYLFNKNIHKSLKYGDRLRQNLDVYIPNSMKLYSNDKISKKKNDSVHNNNINELTDEKTKKVPVLIFIGGGAWIVGHKCFCALIGKIFMSQDIIVVAPDYRQFPQVRADEMLQDIDTAIQWTIDNIHIYGGDKDLIFLSGQSAGAHLTSTLVLEHARTEFKARKNAINEKDINGLNRPSGLESIVEGPDEDEESFDRADNELKKILKHRRRKSETGSPEMLDKIIETNKKNNKKNVAEENSKKNDNSNKKDELKQILRKRRRKSETASSVLIKEGAESKADAVHGNINDDNNNNDDAELRSMARKKSVEKLHAKELKCQPWKLSNIKGYIGISGPYHLPKLREHLFDRGIEQLSFLTNIVGGENNAILTDEEHDEVLDGLSPALRLRRGTFEEMKMTKSFIDNVFPRILLIHGDSDNVVPKESTKEFAKSLRNIGATVTVKYLAGASHTDPIIEDLLYDESNGKEAGAISELIDMIQLHRSLHMAAKSARKQRSILENNSSSRIGKGRRSPSMLADGFGFVTEERGRAPQDFIPRILIRAARLVNPF